MPRPEEHPSIQVLDKVWKRTALEVDGFLVQEILIPNPHAELPNRFSASRTVEGRLEQQIGWEKLSRFPDVRQVVSMGQVPPRQSQLQVGLELERHCLGPGPSHSQLDPRRLSRRGLQVILRASGRDDDALLVRVGEGVAISRNRSTGNPPPCSTRSSDCPSTRWVVRK
jgi:hypothetical protein